MSAYLSLPFKYIDLSYIHLHSSLWLFVTYSWTPYRHLHKTDNAPLVLCGYFSFCRQRAKLFSFSFSVFQLPIVHSVCAKFCTICCCEMLVGICRPPHFTTIAYAKFGGNLVNYGQMENRGWPCSGVCYIVHVIVCLQCHGPNHYQLLYTKWIREILYLVLLSWAQLWTKWKN